MSDAIERQRQRELRGCILRSLGTVYGRVPDTVSSDSLRHVAGLSRSREDLRTLQAALQLLVDLGYVERQSNKVDALDHDPAVVFRLSGKGMQLLNGDIEDASITL